MKREIKITLTDESTNLQMTDDTTALDVFLSIAVLFDMLEPNLKDSLLEKLENLSSSDAGHLLN